MFKNLNPSALGITGHQSEIIELALTYGFAGMDLNVVEFASRAKLKGMDYAKRLIQSANIRVGTFALPLQLAGDDETFQEQLKKLPEYASHAAELGCSRATAVLAPADDARPYHENFEFHRGRLQEVCAALEPSGVRLAVGFQAAEYLRRDWAFQFIHDLDALTLLMNMAASANLGLLLDVWDVVACGGNLESVRKLPVEQIVAVQVADMPSDASFPDLDEKSRILPGGENGRIDVAGFIAVLREAGYDGPVTLKTSRGAFSSGRRDVIVKQAAEALGKVLNPQPRRVAEEAVVSG
ncbi:MAG: sugar phosphate isomerase/epimerase [Pirellulales bacterium]|nr:sugar phosphate isomerase/epimerase [Pirellulales bacterium]